MCSSDLPDAGPVHIEGNRIGHAPCEVVGVDVYINSDAIRIVIAWFIEEHVSTGHQEEPLIMREEKTTGVCQLHLAGIRAYSNGTEEQRFSHD